MITLICPNSDKFRVNVTVSKQGTVTITIKPYKPP
jgi:hypothetical protein